MEEVVQVYEAALEASRSGEPVAIATVIGVGGSGPREVGAKMLVYRDGRTIGTVGGGAGEARVIREALDALSEGQPREIEWATRHEPGDAIGCADGLRVFIEVLAGQPTILIVGAGHVARAVAELGARLGYAIVVVDERPDLLTHERFPNARDLRVGAPNEVLRGLALGPGTFVVIVTPHQARDEVALAVLAGRPVEYVGLMGGRRRTEATFARARALGVSEEFLRRVHTPIGLKIGAETPREIAVSIVAQVISVSRGLAAGGEE